jgi:hypothetical protein
MNKRQASLLPIGLLLFGLTPGCAGAHTWRTVLPVTRLVADAVPSPSGSRVDLYAVPVQFDSVNGQGADASGYAPPVAIRLAREVVTTPGGWASTSAAAPTRVLTRAYSGWSERAIPGQLAFSSTTLLVAGSLGDQTVPLLPYGAFWIEVTNRGEHDFVLDPKRMRLRSSDPKLGAVLDAGAIEGRYQIMLGSLPPIDPTQLAERDDLRVLRRAVRLAAGASWKGYVVFDAGSYTADEYIAFLAQSGGVTLELSDGGRAVALAHFDTHTETVDATCPGTARTPSVARCGLSSR